MAVKLESDLASAKDVAELRELVDRYNREQNQGEAPFDLHGLGPLYQRDDEFVAYDLSPPNEGYFGWTNYEAAWHRIMSNYAVFHLEANDDVRIGLKGDMAWTSFSFRVWGERQGGAPYEAAGRATLVWARNGSTWRIVHEHVSTPRQPPK